jgi:hypothetical protein
MIRFGRDATLPFPLYRPDISLGHLQIRSPYAHNIYFEQISQVSPCSSAKMVSFNYDYAASIRLTAQGIELPAYIIGALTAGGGTFGYLKTGSLPSIIAGLTVGSLVCNVFQGLVCGADRSSILLEAIAFKTDRHMELNLLS